MLELRGLRKRFGGLAVLQGVDLDVAAGSITALIGPNGAGKTTCFAAIAGFVKPDAGTVLLDGVDITGIAPERAARAGLVRTFQITQPFGGISVAANIRVGAYLRIRDRTAATRRAREIGTELGLGALLDRPAGALTVAGRKRLELARALATEPRLLLLDEVMAGLNPSEINDIVALIRGIRDRGVTILMTEHVMQAVTALAERCFVLAGGSVIARGTMREIAADSRVIEAYLGSGAPGIIGSAAAAGAHA